MARVGCIGLGGARGLVDSPGSTCIDRDDDAERHRVERSRGTVHGSCSASARLRHEHFELDVLLLWNGSWSLDVLGVVVQIRRPAEDRDGVHRPSAFTPLCEMWPCRDSYRCRILGRLEEPLESLLELVALRFFFLSTNVDLPMANRDQAPRLTAMHKLPDRPARHKMPDRNVHSSVAWLIYPCCVLAPRALESPMVK